LTLPARARGLEGKAVESAHVLRAVDGAIEFILILVVLFARAGGLRGLLLLRRREKGEVMTVSARIAVLARVLVAELIADLGLLAPTRARLLAVMEEAAVGAVGARALSELKALLRRDRDRHRKIGCARRAPSM